MLCVTIIIFIITTTIVIELLQQPQHFTLFPEWQNVNVSTEEYVSPSVLSEFSRTPVLVEAEQQDQRVQLPQSREGLGKRVCRR